MYSFINNWYAEIYLAENIIFVIRDKIAEITTRSRLDMITYVNITLYSWQVEEWCG